MTARIALAEEWHGEVIASKARPADVAELWAIARASPGACMRHGRRLSVRAFTGLIDDEPVCMFGATPFSILGGIGIPWMVGSTGLDSLTAQKALLALSRPCLAELSAQFPVLVNAVDERNTSAKRWLRWLGFTLGDPIPMGPDGLLFRPFVLRA